MKEITKEQQIANHFKELTGNKQEGILSMALEKIHKDTLEPVFASEKKKKFSLFGIKKLMVAALVAIILGTLTVSTNAEALEKVMAIVGKIVIKEQ